MKIYSVQQQKPSINLLLYGTPGVGKTTFAASAQDHPDLKDVLFVNVEGGLLTVANRNIAAIDIGFNEDGSKNGKITQDLEEIVWSILQKKPGFERFKTLVVDSVTELQSQDLEDIVNNSLKTQPNHEKNKDRKLDDVFQEDYGKNTARLRRVFRMLRDSPINLICTALTKSVMPPPSKNRNVVQEPIEVCPSLTKGVGESLMGYVDFVWYMYRDKEGKRKILTEDKGIVRAKTRNEKFQKMLGTVVDEPSMPEMYEKLIASLKETK